MLSRRIADKLRAYPTPFYLYDLDLLRRTLDEVKKASLKHGYTVHYAVKANFEDRIVQQIAQAGFGADCVSGNEVRHAIEMGVAPSKIVYAGVGKSDSELVYSLEQGIYAFNCESRQELEVIDALAAGMGKVARVALRINPDVDPMTHHYIATGHGDSKFGIAYSEIGEVMDELPRLKNIKVSGLHFHIGSQIRQNKAFRELCGKVNKLYEWFTSRGLELEHINVGGGLGIDYKHPEQEPMPDFEGYFEVFAKNLQLPPHIEVHFELGRSLVAQCGELVSTVLFNKKTIDGKNVAIIDGSMTELIRPALYGAKHAMENLTNAAGTVQTYTVAGTVCESSDTFLKDVELPELRRGDLVTIKSAGAYGSAMASRYNMHELPRSVFSDEIKG